MSSIILQLGKGRINILGKKVVAYIGNLLIVVFILAVILNTFHSNNPIDTTRVACIGNSITQYSGYPTYLQTMLGSSYNVRNFGLSGSTVLLNTETPYLYNHQITNAKDFLPNTVIIMLGSNDARTDRFHSITNFTEDYKELIRTIKEFDTKPEIFLVKPPPIFENYYNLESENLLRRIVPRIEKVANELDLPIIDVYGALENHPEYFPDGVHPSSEGAYLIAEKIHETIILYDENS